MGTSTVSSSSSCPAKTDCKKAWDKVNEEVKKISNIEDPLERNNEINKAYANLFLENPDLPWAGAAAIASKNVGCALESAEKTFNNAVQPFPSPIDIFLEMPGAKVAYDRLGKGNKAIFEDMYSTHLFYAQNGKNPEILKQCAGSHPNKGIKPKVLEAFEDLEKGDISSYMKNIMNPEQELLQVPEILDSNTLEMFLDLNQFGAYCGYQGAKAMESYYSNGCEKPSDQNLILKFEKGDFTNLEDRKDYAQKGLDRFEQLYRERPDYMKKIIDNIARNGR